MGKGMGKGDAGGGTSGDNGGKGHGGSGYGGKGHDSSRVSEPAITISACTAAHRLRSAPSARPLPADGVGIRRNLWRRWHWPWALVHARDVRQCCK